MMTLTPAEQEVANGLGQWETVKAIAVRTGRDVQTVYTHVYNIAAKLGWDADPPLKRVMRWSTGVHGAAK